MSNINDKVREILESNIIIDTLSHGPILWTDGYNDQEIAKLAGQNFLKVFRKIVG